MIFVLDASALLAYLRAEPGGEVVDSILGSEDNACYVHAVNLCEVYYDTIREFDKPKAQATIEALLVAGIIVRDDMDAAFWQFAGDCKAPGGISLADCFCIVLASRLVAEIVTADRREFGPAAERGMCRVKFVR